MRRKRFVIAGAEEDWMRMVVDRGGDGDGEFWK